MYENEPRSIGGVLDAGIRLYRGSFKRITVTAAKGFVAVFVFQMIFSLVFNVSLFGLNVAGQEVIDLTNSMAYPWLLLAIGLIWLLTMAAIILHLHRIATDAPEAGRGVYAAALRRVPAYLGAFILYFLAIAIGFIVLIIPGIYLSIALTPAIYLVFTERLGPIAALRRAAAIVRHNWWRTATVVLVSSVIVMAIQAGLSLLPALVLQMLSVSGDGHIGMLWISMLGLLNGLGQTLAIPLTMAITLALVRDLMLRASGEDLNARLDATEG